jgi:HD-GYP domain-containing protein (c-di-GMP phosphodiesterase class II)
MQDLSQSELAQRLEQLTELSVELSSNPDVSVLLERILKTAKDMTRADGGTLYRISEDGRSLVFNISLNDSLDIYTGGTRGEPLLLPPIPLYTEDGNPNLTSVAAYAANMGISVNVEDVYQADVFNFSGMRRFDEQFGYRSQSFLTVPMRNHEGELIGVLQLINACSAETGKPCPFSQTDQRFIEALASQAAISITQQQLMGQLEHLFESLVNVINLGIDEKSAHTGKHCQLVPELTMMLADAANTTADGPLADFVMTDNDRKQLWLAGLLHDCGKITTPVHVVDKATKLETIFDRIHMVDTRFEVLRRDREIAALRRKLETRDPKEHAAIDADLAAATAQLDDDRAFLRRANVGGEGMRPEDQARVAQIAAYRWTGPDGREQNFLSDDEALNLNIRFGTLTENERKIINNHISVSIRMLESLPWPKHLRNVTEYAAGHHERMDGKGYPKGLRAEEMSVPARLMAVADIFEALTSADRPYKKGKMLSESLHILGNFALNGHIDPAIFDMFMRQKVYLRFAERFMDPKQIDAINEAVIPGYQP